MTENTLLFRQVNPNFIVNGEIGVVAFRPNDNDEGLLSVYDGDLITAENSFKHWIEVLKKKSIGVLAVAVKECTLLELPAASSPKEDFESHAHIDFSAWGKKEQRSKTKALLEFAIARNWVHRPED